MTTVSPCLSTEYFEFKWIELSSEKLKWLDGFYKQDSPYTAYETHFSLRHSQTEERDAKRYSKQLEAKRDGEKG